MLVTEGTLAHVGQLDGAFGTRVHEPVATQRVELGRGNHLCELFHVGRLDIDNIEALVLYVEIP
jgi:hypothetical protein